MSKKITISAAATALALSLAFGLTAFAEDTHHEDMRTEKGNMKSIMQPLQNMLNKIEKFDTREFSIENKPVHDVPSTLTVNPQGNTRITNGKVTAMSGDIITVEIWRLSFSVHKMPDTKVFASNSREMTFDQIAVGDMVDVLGQMDTATVAFIHAQGIHDRTQSIRVQQEQTGRLQAMINELIQKLNTLLLKAGKPLLPTQSPTASPSSLPSSSPSPSPSPSVSSSPSSSPTPTPSPSSSPSPSPSPSPSATPSPSPSHSPSPSPSPSTS